MAAIINYYDLQAPDETATTLDEVAEYVDYLADFFAEKMGMFIREDLTVKSPSYAQYSYVKFLSLTDGGDPTLAIFNNNSSNISTASKNYNFCACVFSGGDWIPHGIYPYDYSNMCVGDNTNNYGLYIGNLSWNTYKRTLKVIDFRDGRKLGVLQAYSLSDGSRWNVTENVVFFKTPIKIQDDTVDTMLYGKVLKSSYLTAYDRYPTGASIATSIYNSLTASPVGSIGLTDGVKEYLINCNLYLGRDCYIPNMCHFSNLKGAFSGNVVTINNKRYVILLYNSSNCSAYIIPEEVN